MQNKLIPWNFGIIIYIYIWIDFKKDYSITYLLEKKSFMKKYNLLISIPACGTYVSLGYYNIVAFRSR